MCELESAASDRLSIFELLQSELRAAEDLALHEIAKMSMGSPGADGGHRGSHSGSGEAGVESGGGAAGGATTVARWAAASTALRDAEVLLRAICAQLQVSDRAMVLALADAAAASWGAGGAGGNAPAPSPASASAHGFDAISGVLARCWSELLERLRRGG